MNPSTANGSAEWPPASAEAGPARRQIKDIISDLSRELPERHLEVKKKGGKELVYLPWYRAIKYLDHFAPGWSNEVCQITSIGGKLVMTVRILIPCAEGIVFREASGQEDEDVASFGDSSSNAESMALRRAAAKFGLGLYLYDQKG